MKPLKVVSYYTKGTPYEQEAIKTIASCRHLGLDYEINSVSNLGSWQANTRYKAQFMLKMLLKHPESAILWVDCDAIIRQKPTLLLDLEADVALRYQDFHYRKQDCLSGTIYMQSNERTIELCQRWIQYNKATATNDRNIEQWNLDKALQEMLEEQNITFYNLPPEYTFIFDKMRKIYPDAQPVIEHFQASRKYRRSIR